MALKKVQKSSNNDSLVTVDVVIPSSGSESDKIATAGAELIGISMPSAWTTAGLSFLGARAESDTPLDLFNDGNEVTITGVDKDLYIVVDPATVRGVPYLVVRSGVLALAVSQGAARTLKLIFRAFH